MTAVRTFDVAVIGGVMGVAAARGLAARKHRVVVFEQEKIGHAGGSSHGPSRIIRLAYGERAYIPLCRAAYAAWRRLEEASGRDLLRITGGLDLCFGAVPSWLATQKAMTQAGVEHDLLGRRELGRRFPQFELPDDARGLFQRDAGVLHAERCLAALAAGALEQGAAIREREPVLGIKPSSHAFEVRTAMETYSVGRVVMAVGAAMRAMLKRTGIDLPLTVSKEQVSFFRPCDAMSHGPERLPVFILHLGGALLSSGFPQFGDEGLKLMIENKRESGEADDAPDIELAARLEAQVQRTLPGVEPSALRTETCRYTLTPDGDFIIDRHPEHSGIVIVSACSGHGFKFGALFGEAVADLVSECTPAIPLDLFRIDRPALAIGPAQGNTVTTWRRTS